MHHHFTNSERIALTAYNFLKGGGFVDSDFTDMKSSKFTELGPTFVSGWGQTDRAVERTITFKTATVSPSKPIAVKILLQGAYLLHSNIGWRIQKIELIFTDAKQNNEILSSFPSYNDILTLIDRARQELEHYKTFAEFLNFIAYNPYPAEPENN